MSYYKKFGTVLKNPIFIAYLEWAYRKGLADLARLNVKTNFHKTNFTCLLCGVGNEHTADQFIKFVIKRNIQAKIWIVDLGEEQIEAITKLVKEKYINRDITVIKINALRLEKIIPNESLDWIETDGVLEFFDDSSLEKLLNIWKILLKPDGFITTRDYSTGNGISKITDALRILIFKHWLGVSLFRHTHKEFNDLFEKIGFKYFEGSTPLPTYKRFCIIK